MEGIKAIKFLFRETGAVWSSLFEMFHMHRCFILVEKRFCVGVFLLLSGRRLYSFFRNAAINVVLGGLLLFGGKRNEVSINRRDGLLYCQSFVDTVSALGMLPFLFSGYIPSISDAFLKPCQGSPLPVPRYWIISKPFPTDCCSGEV